MEPSKTTTLPLSPPTQDAIQRWLISRLSEQLGIHPNGIDIHARLDSFGLDSAQALGLMGQAEKFVGFRLSPTLLWNYPTIAELSERLAEDCAQESDDDDMEDFEI